MKPHLNMAQDLVFLQSRIKKGVWLFLALVVLMVGGAEVRAQEKSGVLVIGPPGTSGCLVCHGDKNLYKIEDGKKKYLYVDPKILGSSPHGDVPCVYCHIDFSFEATKPQTPDWRITAGLACKNCHDEKKGIDHRKEYDVYRRSVHGKKLLEEGNFDAPTCASCHGGHDIKDLRKPEEKAQFHLDGYSVCGKCHKDYWNSYDDWYHGRAYKKKAPDAPACWDCHGAHDVYPKTESESKVSDKNLAKTCGKCHYGSTREFAEYGEVIHNRDKYLKENWLYQRLMLILNWVGGLV